MSNTQSYIPTGQTSQVKNGDETIQIQTEYSHRPFPRIKTTVFTSGQVLHKIEKKLPKPIETVEEQNRVEVVIRAQHKEVVIAIQAHHANISSKIAIPVSQSKPESVQSALEDDANKPSQKLTVAEQLEKISGVQRVFSLTRQGEILGSENSEQFKKVYKAVFKSIPELIEIFTLLPGSSTERESGVYEINRDRLYLASVGRGFYLIATKRVDRDTDFEKGIKDIISPSTLF